MPAPVGSAERAAAAAVGMSPATYSRAKQVVQAAEQDPEHFGDLPEQMDETGNVSGAHREMKRRRAELDNGATPDPGPVTKKRSSKKTRDKFLNIVEKTEVLGISLPGIDIPSDLTAEERADAIARLSAGRAAVSKFINTLKKGE